MELAVENSVVVAASRAYGSCKIEIMYFVPGSLPLHYVPLVNQFFVRLFRCRSIRNMP